MTTELVGPEANVFGLLPRVRLRYVVFPKAFFW